LIRIDVLDVDLSFGRILILGEQTLYVSRDRRIGREEDGDAHLALDGLKKALRLV